MFKIRYMAVLLLLLAVAVGYGVYWTEKTGHYPFKLGLDLSGGTQITYTADVSNVPANEVDSALGALQTVIERRVNAFGVGEPVVQIERGGALGSGDYRLVVELPGVSDVQSAIAMIGNTPNLEFKLVKSGYESNLSLTNGTLNPDAFTDTGLTGAYLSRASLQFEQKSSASVSEPVIEVKFNTEGSKLFGQITSANIGHPLAIFLDGSLISAPTIQVAITNGSAVISGGFTAQEAKTLATNLNLGALPVPITLQNTESIGATLGDSALHAGVKAGVIGFLILSLFLILWYRLPGLVAVVSLMLYSALMLSLFKLIPVVLTAAGIAGFVLSVGLAVDANILIAERIKEEMLSGKKSVEAIREGFTRAWGAIRDSNIAHIIVAVILFWLGTSMIKGFALVFGIGVVVSLFTAITASRTFLLAIGLDVHKKVGRFLMHSGFTK